ncbi:hypothetical protein GQ53DRAFT_750961 [Thozetella sp. PMI_491]|nr:hypothetical protein GQ53DRAFT_750961 [Thozetella sp. PMI_491]
MDFDILFGTDHTAEIAHQRDTQLPDKNVGLGEVALPYPGSAQGQFQQSIVGEHATSSSSTSHLSSGPPVIRSQNGTINLNVFHFHYGPSSNKALNSQDISAVSQLLQEVSVDPKAGIGAPRGYQPQRAASFSSSVGSSSSLGASDGSQLGAGSSQSRMSSAMPKHSNGAGKRPHEGGVDSSRPDSKRHQVSDLRNGHSDEKQAS